jgi:integral membrane protein
MIFLDRIVARQRRRVGRRGYTGGGYSRGMSSSQAAPMAPVRSPVGRGVLFRYRFMAYFTAVFLLVLVFVAIPVQIWGHNGELAAVVGQIHGFAYMVYLICAFELTVRLRIPLVKLVLVLLAGTIPFGAFFAERSMTRAWQAKRQAAIDAAAARRAASPAQ